MKKFKSLFMFIVIFTLLISTISNVFGADNNSIKNITREEFCELAINLYEMVTSQPATQIDANPFKDTDNPAVLKANKLEIVYGVSKDTFAPNKPITLQEISVILFRTLRAFNPALAAIIQNTGEVPNEDKIPSWTVDGIRFFNYLGISNNQMNISSTMTKEQAQLLLTQFKTDLTEKGIIKSSEENENSKFKVISDIVYKSIGDNEFKLDIYKPLNTTDKTPVILFIHGGSWSNGDRKSIDKYMTIMEQFSDAGYSIVSIDYRLASQGNPAFPGNVEDCKDAIKWIRKNAEIYKFDSDKIGVLGLSSGGHLALLSALTEESDFIGDDSLKEISSEVCFAVSFAGPTEFTIEASLLASVVNYLGGTWLEKSETYIKASPINYVNENSVPVIFVHGTLDEIVPILQSKKMHQKGIGLGLDYQLIEIKEGKHVLLDLISEGKANILQEANQKVFMFVKQHFEK